jgi:hypothetical protein
VLPVAHELNAKVYTSRQFSKGKFTFDPMASFPRFIIGSMAGLHMTVISSKNFELSRDEKLTHLLAVLYTLTSSLDLGLLFLFLFLFF